MVVHSKLENLATSGGSRNLRGGRSLPSSSIFPPLPFPLEVGPLGERYKLPQRVRGRAPAENKFGAL